MIKISQVFTAKRTEVVTELQNLISETLVPEFNAELEDIRRGYAESYDFAVTQPDVARNKVLELSDCRRKARKLDLDLRRQQFIDSLHTRLVGESLAEAETYGGVISEEMEERNGKQRKVKKVAFPDGSRAKIPSGIYVDYSLFQRL